MDLSDYLDRRYADDRAMVSKIQLQTDSALRTLVETNLGKRGWPYSITNGERLRADRFSESTVAMILHAVAVEYGLVSDSVLVPSVQPGTVRTGTGKKRNSSEVEILLRDGMYALIEAFSTPGSLTNSHTWGENSPLTLTWAYELLKALLEQDIVDSSRSRPILRRIERLAKGRIEALLDDPASVFLKLKSNDDYAVGHPFVLLRSLQLAQAVGTDRWSDLQLGKLPTAFLNQLHTELSNSAIRDGGFDPACLVFALEGLFILNSEMVTAPLLEQVVNVLGSASSVSTHWLPVRPLVANKQGFTLLPQSVEVANSYLRICGLEHDQRITDEPLFTRSFAALQSYTDWLLSRVFSVRIQVGASKEDFQGWQSEHTYRPNIVHSWATSQVVLFMQHYSAMLQQHIAHASREAINLDFRPQLVSVSPAQSLSTWDKQKEKREPLLNLSTTSIFRAYNRVDKLLVAPRATGYPSPLAKYSILLYGPPGTGKTSFCESLAAALRYDLIIVSPSDFIRGGEAGVEERAKRIFDVLLEQSNCVILFDEIDRLLLDRDSSEYSRQGDMFQFMTPSMLTKINDLRKNERSIFVIATNYAERIDGAIKRPGRIDDQIALLPPDMEQRRSIITKCNDEQKLGLSATRINKIASETALYIYSELAFIVESIANRVGEGLSRPAAVTDVLRRQASPTISLQSYHGRFHRQPSQLQKDSDGDASAVEDATELMFEDPGRGPWKEFALLTYLQAETDRAAIPDWAKSVLDQPDLLEELDDDISSRIKDYIDSDG